MVQDKKIIYLVIALFILLLIILLIKIKTTPKYNPEVYADIYNEYESIFGEENTVSKNDENIIQNTEYTIITNENNTQTVTEETTANVEQGNVIGKIIIPKIDIKYPIIKETTTEYLKIAPTKYCGPDVNEIRKFSYSRA